MLKIFLFVSMLAVAGCAVPDYDFPGDYAGGADQ